MPTVTRRGVFILTIFLLGFLANTKVAAGATAPLPSGRPIEIFNTLEFKGDLRALPHWLDTITQAQKELSIFATCQSFGNCSPEAISWQEMKIHGQKQRGITQLRWINTFFNRWPYRTDIETYGQSDYWAPPKEFLKFSGDCEDYSIAKYFALKVLGYPANRLRIVVIKDSIRNTAHAVLAVYTDETIYILDSLSDLVLPHNFYQHYIPQYSVNEEFRWAHIPRLKKARRFQQPSKDKENGK